jgi:hypothetical protein
MRDKCVYVKRRVSALVVILSKDLFSLLIAIRRTRIGTVAKVSFREKAPIALSMGMY